MLFSQKSFRFVRAMVIIMCNVSIMELFYGLVLLLWTPEMNKIKENKFILYTATETLLVSFADLGSMCIIWFVTFKYWETARQFSRLLRLQNARAEVNLEETRASNTIDHNLSSKHHKYACYKWTGFSLIIILSLIMGVAHGFDKYYRWKNNDD